MPGEIAAAELAGAAVKVVGEKLAAELPELFGIGAKAGADASIKAGTDLGATALGGAVQKGSQIGIDGALSSSRSLGLPGLSLVDAQATEKLAARLGTMNPQAPMAKLIDAALQTGDHEVAGSLQQFFSHPIEARGLITGSDAARMTNLLEHATPESIAAVKSELATVHDLAKLAAPDATSAEILSRLGDVSGTKTWVGRLPKLAE
jgi:hypothetical protein